MGKAWRPVAAALSSIGVVALLASCSSLGGGRPRIEPEAFGSTTTHSRRFDMPPAYTCEAARRALLSQGFLITAADGERVNGRKYFQPEAEVHVQLEFHTVCAPDGRGGRATLAFVNALQDRYALKKSNNSASLGVGAIGSLSLPFSSSDDSLVKVASETITSAPFYDRFYKLLQRFMAADADRYEPVVIVPVPPAAAASAPPPAASAASAP